METIVRLAAMTVSVPLVIVCVRMIRESVKQYREYTKNKTMKKQDD